MIVVGTFTSMLPKYVSAAFGSLDRPWKLGPPPQRLRCHLLRAKASTQCSKKSLHLKAVILATERRE
jgi:hypothetical protein